MRVKNKLVPACVTAAAFCVLALAGCNGSAGTNGLTGGVAATVNGTEIQEDTVTTYIQDLRTSQSVTTDETWANWLNTNGYTPSSLREAVINMFVVQELEKAAAAENNVEVTDDELNEQVNSMKANYDSDEAWTSALESAGLTEDSYRENVKTAMLEQKLQEAVVSEEDSKASDETILSYVKMYAPSFDGMKRSSHILFAADDEATAQQVLDQVNAGGDFAALAQQYSTDTGSAANGGDVGWDALSSFVTAYTDGLKDLNKGDTSGLVTSEYGIHIIRCTDVWTAPEEVTSLDQVPSEVVDVIRQMADPSAAQSAFSTYIEDRKSNADIQINDMPENLPYNVDMDKYVSSSSSEATEGEDAEATEGDAVEGDASETESAESTGSAEGEGESSSDASDSADSSSSASEDSASGESSSSSSSAA